mmetsp:Transcript_33804/g.66502  ORF Transcript_33804/g.66502 Transcript_33804/m.66502 type:complete len:356 (-) Transcript_33804:112-1179(-)
MKVNDWLEPVTQLCKAKPDFILFVIPRGSETIYSFCKYKATVEHGVPSQCFQPKTFGGRADLAAICGNAYKQIMSKLGNWCWNIPFTAAPLKNGKKWMIVGVDVSHDKKFKGAYGSQKSGSCVGFTASYDPGYTQYHSYTTTQGRSEEFVKDSDKMMGAALDDFRQKNKAYPDHIIVYRDGVGDSQLDVFVRKEISLYQAAINKRNISPKLTVMTVQKRVQERLFMQCPKTFQGGGRCNERKCDGSEKFHSPQPGTVVDKVVVSGFLSEFLLVPSGAPPGATSTPTKYIILRDDNNFAPDDIQSLTNQMCYMYSNWFGPIRVPSPVMYAHKLAYLFGKLVNGSPHQLLSDKLHYL